MSGGFSSKRNMANGRIGRAIPGPYPSNVLQTTAKNIKRKQPKMSFKTRLRNWLYDVDKADAIAEDYCSDEVELSHDNAIHFAILPASGGRIVQVRWYDRIKDQNTTKLHVITPDENLAEALAHILQIEVFSR